MSPTHCENIEMSNNAARISQFRKILKTLPPDRVVRDVALGQHIPTQAIIDSIEDGAAGDIVYLQCLIGAGLIPAVLQLLDRCEEKLPDVLGRDGDISAPAIWLILLAVAARFISSKDVALNKRMEIARRIGPLVRCMTDDCKRTFFGDNRSWFASIYYFVGLLETLVFSPETGPILVRYEGFTEFWIYSMFWERHRPDIVKESHRYADLLGPNMFETIQKVAMSELLRALIHTEEDTSGGLERTRRLELIASTKIIRKEYNPDCTVTFAAGLFDLFKAFPSDEDREYLWTILLRLSKAQCVDRAMIVRVVKLGMTNVKSYQDVDFLAQCLRGALSVGCNEPGRKLNDELFSVAIKAGLIEMGLQLIVRFGASNSSYQSHDKVLDTLGYLLDDASAASLFKKSAKAVTEHRSEIHEAVRSAEGKTEGKGSQFVEKVRWIITINTVTERKINSDALERVICHRCSRVIQGDQIKTCSKCHRRKCLSFA